jgi:hypothetical protein
VSRLPQEAFTFLDSVPFLEPFKSIYTWNVVEESWVDFDQQDVTRQFSLLAQKNVRYIVLNKPLIAPGFIARWRDWVTFEPVYEDDEVLVYKTGPRAGEDYQITTPLVDGIGLLRASISPVEAIQGGVVRVDVRWATNAAPGAAYQVCFYMLDDRGEVAGSRCEPPIPGWPSSEWGANAVGRGNYVLPIDETLPPGGYRLGMALLEPGSAVAPGEVVTIGEFEVQPYAPQQETELCWREGLCLRGYDLYKTPYELNLNLYWRAPAPLDQSYKRFVHLIDPRDGRVLAQSDAVPRDWTYATDIWEPDEIVADQVTLALDGLESGTYDLRLGWYAVDGSQPLPACPTAGCTEDTAGYHQLAEIELP